MRDRVRLIALIGFAVAGSALILSIPPLFKPDHQPNVVLTTALGFLCVVFAVVLVSARIAGRGKRSAG